MGGKFIPREWERLSTPVPVDPVFAVDLGALIRFRSKLVPLIEKEDPSRTVFFEVYYHYAKEWRDLNPRQRLTPLRKLLGHVRSRSGRSRRRQPSFEGRYNLVSIFLATVGIMISVLYMLLIMHIAGLESHSMDDVTHVRARE